MRKMFLSVALVLVSMFGVSGCGQITEGQFFINAVYMHGPNAYSVEISDKTTTKVRLVQLTSGALISNYEIYRDVPVRERMWYRAVDGGFFSGNYFEIHIHSVRDLQGAGWNHGKSGSGQTNVIEAE